MKTKLELRFLPVLAAWLASYSAGWTQVTTTITPDGKFGSGPITGVGKVFTIPENVGRRAGNNLFHSFSQFDIGTGDTASFTGNAAIQNIMARVTGGTESKIDGKLQSTILGANFYLMNPKGVVFGPGATIDVSGNFAVTTADYVKMGAGEQFAANPPAAEVLSMAAPTAFGFLGAVAPGNITVNGSKLSVSAGKALLFAGGDTTIQASGTGASDGAIVQAPSGTMKIAGVKSGGELDLTAWDVASFSSLGNVLVQAVDGVDSVQSRLIVGGAQAGNLVVKGDNVTVQKSASLRNQISGVSSGGMIEIEARNAITLSENGRLATATVGGTESGKAASVKLTASSVTMQSNGRVVANTFGDAAAGGDILVRAGQVTLDGTSDLSTIDHAGLLSQSGSAGRAGNITIENASSVIVKSDARINTSTFAAGNAGAISIAAGTVSVDDANIYAEAASGSSGLGGPITITPGTKLRIANAGAVSASTQGGGRGGNITITGGKLEIDRESSAFDTGIFATANNFGAGGNISVTGAESVLLNHGSIKTSAEFFSSAGNISISAKQIEIKNQSAIRAVNSGFSGNGGSITLDSTVGDLTIDRSSVRSSSAQNSSSTSGRAGAIVLKGRDISVLAGGFVSSDTKNGRAGTIDIVASNALKVDGTGAADLTTVASGVFDGGNGQGGAVTIGAGSLTIKKATVNNTTAGNGNAGDVTVSVTGAVRIEGDGGINQAGIISQSAGTALRTGNSGAVSVTAGSIAIVNAGQISAASISGGKAGDIGVIVNRGDLFIDGMGSLYQTGIEASAIGGAAGRVTVAARDVTLLRRATIENNIVSGVAGVLNITAAGSLLVDSMGFGGAPTGVLSYRTSGGSTPGNAGSVTLNAQSVRLKGSGAEISAFSSTGGAGSVSVNSRQGNIELLDKARIGVETFNATSSAGDISLSTPADILVQGGSKLRASAAGSGGNIIAKARFIVLDMYQPNIGALITADAQQGKGGVITLNSLSILPDDARLFDVNSRSGNPGTVTVRSQFDLASSIALPSVSFLRPDTRVRLECQRDQPFANTLDLSGVGSDGLYSDPILQLTPVEGLKK